jgi:hypothetical protein
MVMIVADEEWTVFRNGSVREVGDLFMDLALEMELWRLKKNRRGLKKPAKPKNKFAGMPQVSTARLLAGTG